VFHLTAGDEHAVASPALSPGTRPWDRNAFNRPQVQSAPPPSVAGITTEPLAKPVMAVPGTASQALLQAGFPHPSIPQARAGTSSLVSAGKPGAVPPTGTQPIRTLQPERR